MAIVKQGILGTLSGKVGNIVACSYRGNQVFRSMPRKSTKSPTEAQLAQRMRFGMTASFLTPLKSIIAKGYGNRMGKASPAAQCLAYHTKYAIIGTFPNFKIDYSQVILTTGRLSKVSGVAVCSKAPNSIHFSWEHPSLSPMAYMNDEAILVAYSATEHRHEFLRTKYTRASQQAALSIPSGYSGQSLYCWIIFISADGKEFSTSSYVGTVTIA